MSVISKSWCITDFDTSDKRKQFYRDLEKNKMAMGNEFCNETGKAHLQIEITFKKAYRFAGIKKLLGDKCHIEAKKGIDWNYCLKEMNYEIDDRTQQGKRTDLDDAIDCLKDNGNLRLVAMNHPKAYVHYYKGLEKLLVANLPLRDWEMKVYIRWGPPGTGKTRYIWDNHAIETVYPKMTGKWWDHYSGQEVVLIDDFDPSTMFESAFDWYLKLFDRYPMFVEFKGGSVSFCSKIIYITSNIDPATWFTTRPNRDAFFRRVVTVTEVS